MLQIGKGTFTQNKRKSNHINTQAGTETNQIYKYSYKYLKSKAETESKPTKINCMNI